MANKDDIVTFLNSSGEPISNDPRWHAKQLLSQDTKAENSALEEANARAQAAEAEIEELRRRLAEANSAGVDLDDEDEDESEDEFSQMSGKELQAYAKENKLNIKGLKTVGEVRARLRELTAGE